MPEMIQLQLLDEDGAAPEAPAATAKAPPPVLKFESSVDYRLHKIPFSLLDEEMDSERERLRLREAFWISLIFHALMIAAIVLLLPRLVRHRAVASPLEMMLQDHDLTFLQLPPSPKPELPKQADKISDQNRVAALRHPDANTLQKLTGPRAGAPGLAAPQQSQPKQAAAQPAQPQPAQRAAATAPASNSESDSAQSRPQTQARATNPFNVPRSAGSQIQQAIQASVQNRSVVGSEGDYGVASAPQPTKLRSQVDVMSDTMGVDFGPYLSRVLQDIRRNWFNLIPEEARPPLMKQGKVSIEFVIQKDGSVAGMRVIYPSGDAPLDRAAWGGVTASNPFQPLPVEFKGPYLALRLHFFYNPDRSDLR